MSSYAIMIAAAFIIATVAVAALSPFDHLPQNAPQSTAAAAPADDGSNSSPATPSTPENKIQWPAGEAPPPAR